MKLPKSFLAPIFGYTNAPFRILCQRYGAEAAMVPLINVKTVINGKADRVIDAIPMEKNLAVQLSGSKPHEFAEAAKIIEKRFPFVKRFDVNSGCPSDKAVLGDMGAALMKNPETTRDIVKAIKKESDAIVSVKTRIFKEVKKTLSIVAAVWEAEADFIIVHARTPSQKYAGRADWGMIKEIHESTSLPIVGNGDIASVKEGMALVQRRFCSSFMIGRAAMQNPMVFDDKTELNYEGRKELFLEYVELCRKLDCLDVSDLRIKSTQFFRNIPNSAPLRNELFKSKTVDELLKKLSEVR